MKHQKPRENDENWLILQDGKHETREERTRRD